MCGRYNIIPDAEAWVNAFSLFGESEITLRQLEPSYNVAPTQMVPVIRQSGSGRELVLAHWGLIPFWAKDKKLGVRMINARAETVAEKPAFRTAFRKRRCLVPVNGYYEWKKTASGKQPMLLRMKNEAPFALAGLWETWRNPVTGEDLLSCTIITTMASTSLMPIHVRMPIILYPGDYGQWLNLSSDSANDILKSCSGKDLTVYPVSTFVNSPKNNDPRCMEPLGGCPKID